MHGFKKSRMVLEAKRDVKYRYICEKCDMITEWFTSVLYADEIYELKSKRLIAKLEYDPEIIKETKQEAIMNLRNLTGVFKRILKNINVDHRFAGKHTLAVVFNKIFCEGNACPHCGYRQSWYPMDTTHGSLFKYIKIYVLSFMVFGNVLGLLFVVAYTRVHSMPSMYILGFQIVLLSLGWLFGFVRGNYLIAKRKSTRKLQAKRNEPEVVWGEITVDVRGVDQLDYDDKGTNDDWIKK